MFTPKIKDMIGLACTEYVEALLAPDDVLHINYAEINKSSGIVYVELMEEQASVEIHVVTENLED